MTNILGLGILCLLVLSCSHGKHSRNSSPPKEKIKERSWLILDNSQAREGTTDCGTVFVKTVSGEAKRAADVEILLVPVNEHTTNLATNEPRQVINLEALKRGTETYHALTRSDSDGRFCFENIPQGRFYMISNVPYLITSRMGDAREMWKEIDKMSE